MTVEEMRENIYFLYGESSSWGTQIKYTPDNFVLVLYDIMIDSKIKELEKAIETHKKLLDKIKEMKYN